MAGPEWVLSIYYFSVLSIIINSEYNEIFKQSYHFPGYSNHFYAYRQWHFTINGPRMLITMIHF